MLSNWTIRRDVHLHVYTCKHRPIHMWTIHRQCHHTHSIDAWNTQLLSIQFYCQSFYNSSQILQVHLLHFIRSGEQHVWFVSLLRWSLDNFLDFIAICWSFFFCGNILHWPSSVGAIQKAIRKPGSGSRGNPGKMRQQISCQNWCYLGMNRRGGL